MKVVPEGLGLTLLKMREPPSCVRCRCYRGMCGLSLKSSDPIAGRAGRGRGE